MADVVDFDSTVSDRAAAGDARPLMTGPVGLILVQFSYIHRSYEAYSLSTFDAICFECTIITSITNGPQLLPSSWRVDASVPFVHFGSSLTTVLRVSINNLFNYKHK
jgi:hypothetical protein